MTSPLRRIIDLGRKISRGDLEARTEGRFTGEMAELKGTLEKMVSGLKAKIAEAETMRALANYGRDYAAAFEALYPELASAHGALLYPFFLEGVVGRADLNQADGLHPKRTGVDVIVAGILPVAETFLRRLGATQAQAAP